MFCVWKVFEKFCKWENKEAVSGCVYKKYEPFMCVDGLCKMNGFVIPDLTRKSFKQTHTQWDIIIATYSLSYFQDACTGLLSAIIYFKGPFLFQEVNHLK